MSQNIPPTAYSLYELIDNLGMGDKAHGNMGLVNPNSPYWLGTGYIKTLNGTENFTQSGYPYDTSEGLWITRNNVNGSVTHLPNNRGVRIAIDGQINSSVTRQSKQNFVYSAGNYNEVTFASLVSLEEGREALLGIGDEFNGFFFRERKVNGVREIFLVRRTSASGVVVEEEVPQSQWNIDTLDGNGDSGITLDLEKIQMQYIGYTWYGGGCGRLGFIINDVCYLAHRFQGGNRLQEPILGEPSLPLTFSLSAQAGAPVVAGESSIEAWGAHFSVLGADPATRKGFPRSTERLPFNVSSGNLYHLISIRPKVLYKGLRNHSWIKLIDFHVFGTAEGVFRVLYNATPSGGAWVDAYAGDNSFMEVNNTATALTDEGLRLYSGGITSNRGGTTTSIPDFRDPLTPWSDGSQTNTLTLAFQCTGNGNIGATINHEEIQ